MGVKGKKPTVNQRKFMFKRGFKGGKWLVQKDTPEFMQLLNRDSGEEKVVQK